jgi:hypothetical protein
MDGHGTHTHNENIEYCRTNNIDVCFLPPHTSHLTQPLDVGIFNAYKAAYRRSNGDSSLQSIDFNQASEATRKRTFNIGRALLAKMYAMNCKNIRSAFFKSGIYPISFYDFLHNASGVLGIPPDVKEEVRNHMENSARLRQTNATNRGRIDVNARTVVFRSTVEI